MRVFCINPDKLVMLARSLALAITVVIFGTAVMVITAAMATTMSVSKRLKPR
jgi:hypothetical protein